MLRQTIWTLFLLVWGLWFGGILFLFLAVTALFAKNHELGISAAPVIFFRFEKYHLALALIAIALSSVLPTRHARLRLSIFTSVAIGCVTSLISSLILTPQINSLHLRGLANTPAFWHLHAISSTVYLVEAIVLLITGLLLAAAMTAGRI